MKKTTDITEESIGRFKEIRYCSQLANQYAKKGLYDLAIENYRRALSLDKKYHLKLLNREKIEAKIKDLEDFCEIIRISVQTSIEATRQEMASPTRILRLYLHPFLLELQEMTRQTVLDIRERLSTIFERKKSSFVLGEGRNYRNVPITLADSSREYTTQDTPFDRITIDSSLSPADYLNLAHRCAAAGDYKNEALAREQHILALEAAGRIVEDYFFEDLIKAYLNAGLHRATINAESRRILHRDRFLQQKPEIEKHHNFISDMYFFELTLFRYHTIKGVTYWKKISEEIDRIIDLSTSSTLLTVLKKMTPEERAKIDTTEDYDFYITGHIAVYVHEYTAERVVEYLKEAKQRIKERIPVAI